MITKISQLIRCLINMKRKSPLITLPSVREGYRNFGNADNGDRMWAVGMKHLAPHW
jgi:hypothetical protein